jgi:hypothetical protein
MVIVVDHALLQNMNKIVLAYSLPQGSFQRTLYGLLEFSNSCTVGWL